MDFFGYVDPKFLPVARVFDRNLSSGLDIGASFCVYFQGAVVLDIWGGEANAKLHTLWHEDTIQLCFSASKGITAIAVLQLYEQGVLDIDLPLARYWPEFAENGKSAITTRMVLSHRAGIVTVDGEFTLDEVIARDKVISSIAMQKPNWEPNTEHGYHTRTFGWILGELVRRITGKSLSDYVRLHISEPLGVDFWFGLPDEEMSRCAKLSPDPTPLNFNEMPDQLTIDSLTGPSKLFRYDEMWNDKAILQAEMPSSNGVTNARALAKIYTATMQEVNGVRLLSDETVAKACEIQSQGKDRVVGIDSCFGLGFMLPPWLANNHVGGSSYGHVGAGGSIGFADSERRLAVGYVMNQMSFQANDTRAIDLIDAVYQCILE